MRRKSRVRCEAGENLEMISKDYLSLCTLNQQRFYVGSCLADASGFLLAGALVVLGSKPGSGTEMLGCGEHGHIHPDFRNDANSGKGENTRHGTNKLYLVSVLLGKSQNLSSLRNPTDKKTKKHTERARRQAR